MREVRVGEAESNLRSHLEPFERLVGQMYFRVEMRWGVDRTTAMNTKPAKKHEHHEELSV
jgi:hypothetical protein